MRALIPRVLVVLLAVGCASDGETVPSDEVTPRATSTSAAQPTGRQIAVGPDLAVVVPKGWHVLREEAPWPGGEPTSLCLLPPGNHLPPCAGVYIAWGQEQYRPDQPRGWYDGSEVSLCPVGNSPHNLLGRDVRPPTDAGRRTVGGGHQATWSRWHETCADGATFDPQVWHLPEFEVLFRDQTGHPETAQILASAVFREDGAKIPAAATHENAWVTAVHGDTFTIEPVPAGAPRKIDLSQAICTGWFPVPGEILAPGISCSRFAGALRHSKDARVSVLLWLEADGTVAQVSQDFRAPQSEWIPHDADSSSPG